MLSTSASIPELGIEMYNWWNEALHGVARSAKATVFPQAIAMGATFDPELIQQTANAISDEARACLLYTSPSPRDRQKSRMPSSA